jgi:hypothetical protein
MSIVLPPSAHAETDPNCKYLIQTQSSDLVEMPNHPGVTLERQFVPIPVVVPEEENATISAEPINFKTIMPKIEQHFRENDYIYIFTSIGILALILICAATKMIVTCAYNFPNRTIRVHLRRNNRRRYEDPIIEEIPDNQLVPLRENAGTTWKTTPNGIEIN